MPEPAAEPFDPRAIITPDAFKVADRLIGTPLATPARRAFAMLIDLVCVGILAIFLEAPALIPAIIGAVLIYRFSRGSSDRWWTRLFRRGIGCFGALLVFSTVMAVWGAIFWDDQGVDWGNVDWSNRDYYESPEEEEALAHADSVLAEAGVDISLREEAGLVSDAPASDTITADDEAGAATELDSLARLNNRIAVLESELRTQEQRTDAVADELDDVRDSVDAEIEAVREATDRGPMRQFIAILADDFGIGLGWLGLYFTAFLVLGRGQTPGKRLARIRVIRLDAQPIGWWIALQRFGGYSASFFTGLIGFFEIFWDDNRQGLQDKLVHTVVIDETGRARADTAGDDSPP